METVLLREKLHTYINNVDDRKLEAIYTILETEIEGDQYQFSNSEIKEFFERRSNHLNGNSKSYSIEETLKLAKKQH